MVAEGVKVFHSGKAVVLRRVFQIMSTGASICVLAFTVKTVTLRGQFMVVRPFAGGQGGKETPAPPVPQGIGIDMGTGDMIAR